MLDILNVVGDEYTDYLSDESKQLGHADSICFPRTEWEVLEAVNFAAENHQSVTLQGALTGISSGAVPHGGMIVNLSRMKRILGMCYDGARDEFSVVVEPGVLLCELGQALHNFDFDVTDWSADSQAVLARMKDSGRRFLFTPDPTETTASLGGMVACNASGAKSYRYGATRLHVVALRVVLDNDVLTIRRGRCVAEQGCFTLTTQNGRVISGVLPEVHQSRASKVAAGYPVRQDMDLIDLFIGAEGTLGAITQMELQLQAAPKDVWGIVSFLPNEDAALDFVERVRGAALDQRPVAVEYFGCNALNLLRHQHEAGLFNELPELKSGFNTAVYTEYQGDSETAVSDRVLAMCEFLEQAGGNEDDAWIADNEHERERLRLFRHAVPESVNLYIAERKKHWPDLTKLGTDMAVPDEFLKPLMAMYRSDLEAAGLKYVIFGHVGNNHLHVNIIPRDPDEYSTGKALYMQWARKVVEMGGTVSAEHGIGKLKVPFMKLMYSADELSALKGVRTLFDPAGRFNIGNLFE